MALTIGFGRRFATYKRANLIFRNIPRLRRLLVDHARTRRAAKRGAGMTALMLDEATWIPDDAVEPIGADWVVLDIGGADVRFGLLEILLVQHRIVEFGHVLLVAVQLLRLRQRLPIWSSVRCGALSRRARSKGGRHVDQEPMVDHSPFQ